MQATSIALRRWLAERNAALLSWLPPLLWLFDVKLRTVRGTMIGQKRQVQSNATVYHRSHDETTELKYPSRRL